MIRGLIADGAAACALIVGLGGLYRMYRHLRRHRRHDDWHKGQDH